MSFILDALRKSDQQRHRSTTPTLMSAQLPAESAKQPALLWYGVLAAVLLGAGILIGGLRQWQSEPVAPAAQANTSKLSETSMQKFAPPPSPAMTLSDSLRKAEISAPARETGTTSVRAATPLPTTPIAAPAVATPANVAAVAVAPVSAQAQPEAAIKPALPSPAAATPVAVAPAKHEERTPATDASRDSGVINMAELPPMIQQELPKLAILAHSYSSKPKARFVFINDRMVHEEESPAPGLKLEQITPEGMIFSYKGYRFRRSSSQ
jgi:general secretion pathway protein B